MTSSAQDIVARARSLIGSPFRPQGRNPQSGVDCVGLVLWTFGIAQHKVRRNYRLRGFHEKDLRAELTRWFRPVSAGETQAGDVLLCAVSADQMHLAISCGDSFVHADARLRRIVETPGEPHWPILGAFRREATKSKSS